MAKKKELLINNRQIVSAMDIEKMMARPKYNIGDIVVYIANLDIEGLDSTSAYGGMFELRQTKITSSYGLLVKFSAKSKVEWFYNEEESAKTISRMRIEEGDILYKLN
jgi:hypothetical protein